MILPITVSKYNLLKSIYYGKGIRFTDLMKKAKASTATAQQRVKELIDSGVAVEKIEKSGKKVLNRKFYPNFESEEGRTLFSLVELDKKSAFLKRYAAFAGPVKHLLNESLPHVKVIIIFGSFANYSAGKESDLDLLFLVDKKYDFSKAVERSLSTLECEISPRIELVADFKKNINDSLHKTIIENHVIISGALDFINIIGRDSLEK